MANVMGSWSVWIKDGVLKTDKTLVRSSMTTIDHFGSEPDGNGSSWE